MFPTLLNSILLALRWDDLYYRFLHSHTRSVLVEAFHLFVQLLPYLIIGIFLSTLIRQYTTAENLKKFIVGKNVYLSIPIAAMLGIVSPLGSYVVIPLSAALLVAGMPLSPMMAFMVSSPLINPGLFVLTTGALGLEMAIVRCISAFVLGSLAGFITYKLVGPQELVLKKMPEGEESSFIKRRTFWNETWQYSKYISKYFFIGIVIAALTKVLIPVGLLSDFLGSDHLLSIFAATLAGVPFYTCGGAELPVIQQLAELGVDKGAILAYFISGPATKMATVALIVSIYRKKIVWMYFLVSLGGAILMGLLYHYF